VVDFEIQQLNMMSVPESRTAVERADGINGRDTERVRRLTDQRGKFRVLIV
jgi:hypothetical protein